MTAITVSIIGHRRRRNHLSFRVDPSLYVTACGLILTSDEAFTAGYVELIGGATTRFRNDLIRELNHDNTCKRCARVGAGMLALYMARDKGIMP